MLTAILCYLLTGLIGYLLDYFGFDMIDAETDETNVPFSLVASMVAWPIPFISWVESRLHGDDE